jgi:glutathione synthase/RimK-type ligase-like ATP-grasp enzyme
MASPSDLLHEGQSTAPFSFREGSCVVGIGKVRYSTRASDTLFLSAQLLEETQFKRGQTLCLQVGRLQRTVRVQAHKREDDLIGLSVDLASALAVPKGKTKWIVHGNTWRIGPFIAVYTLSDPTATKPFGELTELFQDWVLLAQELGDHLYIVTPGSVDFARHLVQAWTFTATNGWKRVWRPCPDFVIQKIVRRPQSLRPLIDREEQYFSEIGCSFLTKSLGSKWEIHELLSRSADLRPFLPHTRLIRGAADVEQMIRQHRSVFVKPVHGTQGERVFRLKHHKNGLAVFWQEGSTPRRCFLKKEQQVHGLRKFFAGKRRYLIQQEVERLKTADEEPVDFRWLLQKDASGCWQMTARVARVGQKRAVTTNVHSGGIVQRAESFLEQVKGPAVSQDLIIQMDRLAERIALCIEQEMGEIGELGIDLAVDRQGNLWFIEVNPRPGRKMLRMLDENLRLLSLQRPLEYAEYTTGF